ncbi:hypothetical protein JTB14_029247 [Gonioctena quinquepunctata]|nr:hypothetical protein JTB14_029247 [Gonioctena quinquepunctata]
MLKFTSHLKKLTLFSNKEKLRNLKSHSVFIANDMSIDQREDQNLLKKYLLLTRKEDQSAKIQNFKLVTEGKQYTISQQRSEEREQVESDSEEEGEEEQIKYSQGTEEIELLSMERKENNHRECNNRKITSPEHSSRSQATKSRKSKSGD